MSAAEARTTSGRTAPDEPGSTAGSATGAVTGSAAESAVGSTIGAATGSAIGATPGSAAGRGVGRVRRAAAHPAAAPLGTFVAGLAAAGYLYGTDPHQGGHWLPRCPFNWATGLLCPVCGATRMAYDLLHADPVRAFHDNALLLLCTPFLLAVAGRWAFAGLRGRRRRPVLGARGAYAVAAVALLWAVVRNLR